jgi:KDO2-lipid IV(A) lauroyltransferase
LSFSLLFFLLGERISRRTADIFTPLVYYFIPIRKQVVIDNLTAAFPQYSKEKIRKLSYQCYKSFIISIIEILQMNHLTVEQIKSKVKFENLELVKENYCLNKGLILLSAHFGNWEYIAASCALQLNIPVNIIVKPQRNPYVNKWMNDIRTRWKNKIIPMGISIRTVYQQLKEKNIVAMVADQRGPAEGIKLEFFGRRTSVYTGPAVLALKTGAPILIGIPVRQPDYSYKAVMHKIRTDNLPDNEDDKIIEITKRQLEYLEEVIRKNPEQWLWMHKRWKH